MKINEVSKRYNLNDSTLRYYEKVGLLNDIKRENGVRDYQDKDLDRIEFILCMKDAGLSIEQLRQYFDLVNEGDGTLTKRKELLQQQRMLILEQMAKLQKSLDKVNFKIDYFEQKIKEDQQIKKSSLT